MLDAVKTIKKTGEEPFVLDDKTQPTYKKILTK